MCIATPDDDIVERVSVTLASTTDEGRVIINFEGLLMAGSYITGVQ